MKVNQELLKAEFAVVYRTLAVALLGVIVVYCVYQWYLESRRRNERRMKRRIRRKRRR
jgi:preprotein translocase subunit Sec63